MPKNKILDDLELTEELLKQGKNSAALGKLSVTLRRINKKDKNLFESAMDEVEEMVDDIKHLFGFNSKKDKLLKEYALNERKARSAVKKWAKKKLLLKNEMHEEQFKWTVGSLIKIENNGVEFEAVVEAIEPKFFTVRRRKGGSVYSKKIGTIYNKSVVKAVYINDEWAEL